MRRLTDEELFKIGPKGLEDLSDDSLIRRLDEADRQAFREMLEEINRIAGDKQ